jgi:hypothetical protein
MWNEDKVKWFSCFLGTLTNLTYFSILPSFIAEVVFVSNGEKFKLEGET